MSDTCRGCEDSGKGFSYAGVAVFVKQLGSVLARERGLRGKADALNDLPADLRIREYPAA